MVNLSLTACSFHFNCKNKQQAICNLNQNISGKTFIELFKEFFNKYNNVKVDKNIQKTFSCDVNSITVGEKEEYCYIHALIRSGVYGNSSDIMDITDNKVKYKKKANESEVLPFYLFVAIPKDSESVCVQKGIFLFQNVGTHGIKTITTQYMRDFFSENYELTLRCGTIAPDLFIDRFLTPKNIKKMVLIKNYKSGDSADNIKLGYGKETRELGGLSFDIDLWGKIINRIKSCANGTCKLFEFEEDEYDDLKVIVDIGGRERRVSVHNIENLSIIESIPDEIRMADGHPNEKLLISHFCQVTIEYLKEMVLQIVK